MSDETQHRHSSLPGRLWKLATERPGAVALREKRLGLWHEYTWTQYLDNVHACARALRARGVGKGDHVAILSDRLEQVLEAMDESMGVQIKGDEDKNIGGSERESSSKACLVHCAFGVSRSAAVCAAWLISRQGLSLEQALRRIRAARPEASPNMGFIASLRALEQCQGSVAAARKRLEKK